MKKIFLLLLITILSSCKESKNQDKTSEVSVDELKKYSESLPASSKLKISNKLDDKISNLVTTLDSDFLSKGREIGEMKNSKMISQVINEAKERGGDSSGNTFFEKLIIDDRVSLTIQTEINKKELELVSRYYVYNSKFKFNEVWFKYKAKLKIGYNLKIGNNEKTEYYFEDSEICSPIKLI